MTYFEAALRILVDANGPMTTHEITERALNQRLILPQGKTPNATMSAALYRMARTDSRLMKLSTPGISRALRGSVRWSIGKTTRQQTPSSKQDVRPE